MKHTFCSNPKRKGWEDCSTHPSPSFAWWKSLHSFRKVKMYKTIHKASNIRIFSLRKRQHTVLVNWNKQNKIKSLKLKRKTWHHLAWDFNFLVWIHKWKLLHFLQAIRLDSPEGSSLSVAERENENGPLPPLYKINASMNKKPYTQKLSLST